MLILLFLSLILIFFLSYEKFEYLLHPVIIVIGVFALSTAVYLMNVSKWGDISYSTYGIIIGSILSFIIGSLVYKHHNKDFVRTFDDVDRKKLNFVIKKRYTFFVIVIMLLITIWDYNNLKSMCPPDTNGFFNVIQAARDQIYAGKHIERSFLLQQGLFMSRALAYIYIYYVLHTFIVTKSNKSLINIIPIILYLLQALLSTGRTELIYIIYAIVFMGYIMSFYNKKNSLKRDFNYFKIVLSAFLLFVCMFVILGGVRSENFKAFDSLSVYIGSPIYALDKQIKFHGIMSYSENFGQYTQYLLIKITNMLGITNSDYIYVLEPISIQNTAEITNIYTAMGRYLRDFSWYGTFIVMFGLGFAYDFLFDRIFKNKSFNIDLILYSLLSFPIVEMAIEERVFSVLLAPWLIYMIIYIFVFKYLLISKEEECIYESVVDFNGNL